MRSFVLGGRHIAHERVDDEVIAINLTTGAYFSLSGTAADCWTLLAASAPVNVVAATLAERYGRDRDQVEADLAELLERLEAEGLLKEVEAPNGAGAQAVELPQDDSLPDYRKPTLDKYEDMEELLLLDPIHEVDEAGWPLLPTEPT